MARSCWRCFEPIENDISRCPSCGARVIPLDPTSASPATLARKIRIFALIILVALILLSVLAVSWR